MDRDQQIELPIHLEKDTERDFCVAMLCIGNIVSKSDFF